MSDFMKDYHYPNFIFIGGPIDGQIRRDILSETYVVPDKDHYLGKEWAAYPEHPFGGFWVSHYAKAIYKVWLNHDIKQMEAHFIGHSPPISLGDY